MINYICVSMSLTVMTNLTSIIDNKKPDKWEQKKSKHYYGAFRSLKCNTGEGYKKS